jgi:acyl carrier protein
MAATDVTKQEIEDLIRGLLVDEFDIDEDLITPEATMEELDLDSLDLVEVGQVVEQKYGVRIRGNDAEDVTNLGGVIDMIYNKIVSGDTGEDEDEAAPQREEVETA